MQTHIKESETTLWGKKQTNTETLLYRGVLFTGTTAGVMKASTPLNTSILMASLQFIQE